MQPLPLSALKEGEFEKIYSSVIKTFNKIQTQVFEALYNLDENIFIGAPTSNGKTICAEYVLLQLCKKKGERSCTIGIEPHQEIVNQRSLDGIRSSAVSRAERRLKVRQVRQAQTG